MILKENNHQIFIPLGLVWQVVMVLHKIFVNDRLTLELCDNLPLDELLGMRNFSLPAKFAIEKYLMSLPILNINKCENMVRLIKLSFDNN